MHTANPWSEKRKEVKALLQPFANSTYATPILLALVDIALFVGASTLVVFASNSVAKVLASFALGVAISRMFVLGHDAAHASLTPSRVLNSWLGRILFLPSMTCFSLWIAGHNLGHHGFTGLRPHDIPWVPLSPTEYLARSRLQRLTYKMYRSWWGSGIYYGYEIWWRRQIFPAGKVRPTFIKDSWLVTIFMALQIAGYVFAAHHTGQSAPKLILLGIVLPFALWLYMAAIVFYVHHTHETARWYEDEADWRDAQPNLAGTSGTQLPLRFDLLLHNALAHTAHHANAAIPCYQLGKAQRALERSFPAEVPIRKISVGRYLAITRRCQLYEPRQHRWVTFSELDGSAAVGIAG